MQIVIIADSFPPMRNSGAVQLQDLSREFINQGHEVTVILPSTQVRSSWSLEYLEGVRILRLSTYKTKDLNYFLRTISEFLMPFLMIKGLSKTPLANELWDGIIWYSPSIFFGPLVNSIKKKCKSKTYLIIRDIFPDWAVEIGLISRRGLVHIFLDGIARYQYSLADFIGVQSPGNLKYFDDSRSSKPQQVEVLQNWLSDTRGSISSISISATKLAERKIFVYAGNMGVAQNLGIFLDLAELFSERLDIGFIFIGRGTQVKQLESQTRLRELNNVLFFDEIETDEIAELCEQCIVGLVALDINHKSHNIPGKFLTYMRSGIPVLAILNPDNDLVQIINENGVGRVCIDGKIESLYEETLSLLNFIDSDSAGIKKRSRSLYLNSFTPEKAVRQIINNLCCKDEKYS